MLTIEELEAQEAFDSALKKAWGNYNATETHAKEIRQNAVKRAYADIQKTLPHLPWQIEWQLHLDS